MHLTTLTGPVRRGIGGLLVAVLVLGGAQDGRAQAEGPSLRSVDRPVKVSVDPVFQWYDTAADRSLNQFSTRLFVSVPLGQRFTVQANGSYAQMGGDVPTTVGGLTDVSGRLTYAQPVGEGSLIFSADINAPTGKQKLNDSELGTTRAFSQNFYDFRVSSFSRGFTVGPTVTWAVPVGDNVAFGIGGTYKYQGGFQPSTEFRSDSLYVPGNGMGGNAGVDVKVTPQSALGLDVSFRRYAADRAGGVDQFAAGNRVTGTLRYLFRRDFTTVRVLARYANWEESEFGFDLPETRRGQIIPSHGMLLGAYQTRLSETVRLTTRASGHWYEETRQADAKVLGRLYVSPSVELSDALRLAPHGTATFGSYLAFGGGLRMTGTF